MLSELSSFTSAHKDNSPPLAPSPVITSPGALQSPAEQGRGAFLEPRLPGRPGSSNSPAPLLVELAGSDGVDTPAAQDDVAALRAEIQAMKAAIFGRQSAEAEAGGAEAGGDSPLQMASMTHSASTALRCSPLPTGPSQWAAAAVSVPYSAGLD